MKNPLTRSLIPTATLLAFASQVAAQNAQASLEQRIADLEARLATQSQQGSSDGDTLSNLFKNGRVDYRLGRGLTFSAQDAEDFSINIGGQVQVGYRYSDDDPTSATNSGFNTRSTRLRFGGNVFREEITYFVQLDPQGGGQGNGNLIDGWAGWQFHERVNLRLGQQKMRSSLQADTSMADTDLEMVNRAIATTTFANQRATGALFEGNAAEGKLNWHFGLMNNGTAGIDGSTAAPGTAAGLLGLAGGAQANQAGTSDIGWTAGASYSNMAGNSEDWSEGDLAHSGNAHWIAGATVTAANEQALIPQAPPTPAIAGPGDALTINVFGGLKAGNGLAVQGEFFARDNDDLNRDDTGFYGQVSYTLKRNDADHIQWGGVLRYSMVDFDTAGEATEISGGINAYYHEH
ncbi:MAG: hypothetical protein KAI24_17370, partial [Planctomycetes bacterium]|nr:hypothetical protein [Planctomycetota bacterium]